MTSNSNIENDTTSYLTEDDIQNINSIMNGKRKLMSYFNNKFMAEAIRDLIKKSKYLKFVSERQAKFIDEKRPTFNLIIDIENFIKETNYKINIRTDESMSSAFQACLNSEVYTPFSKILYDKIKNDNENKDVFKELPEIYDILLISNIFSIRISLNENRVVLEYLI